MARSLEGLSSWRFELKYRMSPMQYHMVKSALVPYMEPDEHTRRSDSGKYLVRSLYFDTSTYQAYHEKIAGDFGRVKMRLRSYGDTAEGAPVRVELKTRRGPVMEKHRCFVTASDCARFLEDWHWPAPDDPVLVEFERMLHLGARRPKVLVEYKREGLEARSRGDLRITFDHDVQSASASRMFPEHPFFRDHHRHQVIMEVKFRIPPPAWLTALVKQYGLKFVANSKYARAIEVSQPDVVAPAWSYPDPEPVPRTLAVRSPIRAETSARFRGTV